MPLSGNRVFSDGPVQLELDLKFEPDEARFRRLGQLLCTPSNKLTTEDPDSIDGVST